MKSCLTRTSEVKCQLAWELGFISSAYLQFLGFGAGQMMTSIDIHCKRWQDDSLHELSCGELLHENSCTARVHW